MCAERTSNWIPGVSGTGSQEEILSLRQKPSRTLLGDEVGQAMPRRRVYIEGEGLLEEGLGRNLPDYRLADYKKHCALGRVGRLDEVARFAAFLVSDQNSYMNGETAIMDGGV